ncbi:MAG: protein kinase, partial [Myxococcota bacterium]|nr:protein kinase [Myxococcota bacterium]
MNNAPHGPGDTAGYIGRYALQELLGKGAMGEVYRAILHGPAGFQKTVALKVLLPSITTRNTDFRATLTNEARLGGLLKHPNVVETYELGEESDLLYIAMEYVAGPTLSRVMRRWKPIPKQAVVNIVSHICQGLAHIHGLKVNGKSVNLVHRDLKPSNILIDRHGLVKIADLGIARAVALDNADDSVLRGTPAYMSPEQMTPGEIDGRADLFALGALTYEMIVGKRLFTGGSTYQILAQIQTVEDLIFGSEFKDHINQTMPEMLPILTKCLRHSKDDRYLSAGSLLRDLRALPHFGGADLYTIIQAETLATTSQNLSYLTTLQSSSSKTNLPEFNPDCPVNLFAGREHDTVKLKGLIQGGANCICITGAPGIGKSRFLIEFLAGIHRDYDGVLLLKMRNSGTSSWVDSFCAALNLEPTESLDKTVQQIKNHLSEMDRILLSFDGVMPHHSDFIAILDIWQSANPRAVWLFSSPIRLKIPDEHVLELKRLSPEHTVEVLNDRLNRRAISTAEIDIESVPFQSFLQILDGHPLTVELAASALSSHELLASMTAVSNKIIEQSSTNPLNKKLLPWWRKLGPFAKLACVQLSVMAGIFSVEAAESVIRLPPAASRPMLLDILGVLYNHSWLYSHEVNGTPHFGMLRYVHAFVNERLSERDAQSTQIRHAAYYAGWSDARFNTKFEQYGAYLAQREIQQAQFLSAMRRSIDNRWVRLAARNAICAIEVHLLAGETQQANQLVVPLLRMKRLPPWEFGRLLTLYGTTLRLEGQFADSLQQLSEAIRLLSMIKDSNGLLDAYTESIYAATDIGRFEHVREAVDKFRKLQSDSTLQHRIGLFAKAEGYSYAQQGKVEDALERLKHAASILWSLKDPVNSVSALSIIGVTHLRCGRPVEAERFFENALQIMQEAELLDRVDHLWMNLGLTAIMTGKLTRARQYFAHAYQRYHSLQAKQPLALLYANTAMLHLLEEDSEASRAWISEGYQMLD